MIGSLLPDASRPIGRDVNFDTYTIPQLQFWMSPARFRLFIGGIGSGKTQGGCTEVLRQPPSVGMIVAPTYPMLRDATQEKFMELARAAGVLAKWNKSDGVALLANGAQVLFRSADDPDRLRGPNLGWFYLDEIALMDPSVWLIMIGRLRLSPGRGWATTTPAGYNWVYDTFVTSSTDEYDVITSSTRDNIFLPSGYLESLLSIYDEFWIQQEVEGLFVDMGQAAYFHQGWLRAHLENIRQPAYDPIERIRDGDRGFSGAIEIYDEPVRDAQYVIGADVAEGLNRDGDPDYSTAAIFRTDLWSEVACYYGRPGPDAFGMDLDSLSTHYNNALIICERNGPGFATLSTLRSRGANIYRHNIAMGPEETGDATRDGFPTHKQSKEMADAALKSAIQANARGEDMLWLQSRRGVQECISYHNLPGGRRGAVGKAKDDMVRAYALAVWWMENYALRWARAVRPSRKAQLPVTSRRFVKGR